jgi:hypothetical protein
MPGSEMLFVEKTRMLGWYVFSGASGGGAAGAVMDG